MGLNHRYVLRMVTDGALGMFLVSAVGVVLWVTDEFLGWNVLPDWVDKYAQLFVVVFGMAAGLLMGASLLCSVALLAEAAAERAGIRDYQVPPRIWRVAGMLMGLFAIGLFVFYRVDLYRKEVSLREERGREAAKYEARVAEFREKVPTVVAVFPAHLTETISAGELSETNQELVTFLSAVRSSTARHPEVLLLTRAKSPYRYCRYTLKERRGEEAIEALGRFYVEKQFYTGFPTEAESGVVEDLFGGGVAPLEARLEGEVIDNVRPGAWGPLKWKDDVAGVLVLRGEFPNRFGFFHTGQGALGADGAGKVASQKAN